MSKVNLQRFAENDARFFALRLRMIKEDNIGFAKEYEALIDKYEKLSIWFLLENFLTEVEKKNMRPCHSIKFDLEESISRNRVDVKVVAGDLSKGIITMLKKNTKEGEMVRTALKLPLSQVLERMTEAVRTDYFSKNLKWLVIYLTDTKDGVPLGLICYRSDGKLSLYVHEVDPDGVWRVGGGRGVGFLSNDPSVL